METLKNKKVIDDLFKIGSNSFESPLMLKSIDHISREFLFAVSSKKFKRAVDRNLIKRKMREAIRRNINLFPDKKAYAIIYISSKIEDFKLINDVVKSIKK